jgi:hypothetical protein
VDARVEGGRRVVQLRLRSARGARMVGLVIGAGRRTSIRVEGQEAPTLAFGGGAMLGVLALTETQRAEGVAIRLDAEGTEPIPLTVFDRSQGVPASVEPAVRARPTSATPTQDGDVTLRATSRAL